MREVRAWSSGDQSVSFTFNTRLFKSIRFAFGLKVTPKSFKWLRCHELAAPSFFSSSFAVVGSTITCFSRTGRGWSSRVAIGSSEAVNKNRTNLALLALIHQNSIANGGYLCSTAFFSGSGAIVRGENGSVKRCMAGWCRAGCALDCRSGCLLIGLYNKYLSRAIIAIWTRLFQCRAKIDVQLFYAQFILLSHWSKFCVIIYSNYFSLNLHLIAEQSTRGANDKALSTRIIV